MQKFRKELTGSLVPANLPTVIKKLIPSKEEEDGNAIDDTSDESGSDNENSDVEIQAEITPTVEFATTANSSNTIPSLTKVSDDPIINKGAKFLDAVQNVFKIN